MNFRPLHIAYCSGSKEKTRTFIVRRRKPRCCKMFTNNFKHD
ncbi:unnamed protein product [Brassica rapa subsp. narinosa]